MRSPSFHAQMAQERGWFDFSAVAREITGKLVRRHPHVFGDGVIADSAAQTKNWEELKAHERAAADDADDSAMAHVALALPALLRAAKLGRRAARVGFDWQAAADVRAKVLEEIGEVDEAVTRREEASAPPGADARDAVPEEVGDLLFAVANWAIHLGVEPEDALRAANRKFEQRFRSMEGLAKARGLTLGSLTPQAWDALWREAKQP
jgi:nucleoside triphosphate diphosphatase